LVNNSSFTACSIRIFSMTNEKFCIVIKENLVKTAR